MYFEPEEHEHPAEDRGEHVRGEVDRYHGDLVEEERLRDEFYPVWWVFARRNYRHEHNEVVVD